MKCKVDGCERDADYKSQCVCQKHYFRMMRYGTYDTTRVGHAKERMVTPNGYVKIYKPDHILSDKNGYAFEHRLALYEKHDGKNLQCEFCDADWLWRPYKDHVDHIDENKQNNSESNLRPLCNSCNTKRTKRDRYLEKGKSRITLDGTTMTANEWSRCEGVSVSGTTILRRIKSGQDAKSAIYTPSRTFKGKNWK